MDPNIDLEGQHAQMLALLHQERLALLDGDIALARTLLARLEAVQESHIAHEEAKLIPRLPLAPRWPARIYVAEHRKLADMLSDLRAALAPLPANVQDGNLRLSLLDAQMAFKHVLEHHFEREEKGLFVETGA